MTRNAQLPLPTLVVLLLAWLVWPVYAAGPKLETYETRHYEIHTNLSRDEAVDIGRHMDLVFREYDRVLRALRGSARGLQPLYLLRTQADYHALLQGKFGIDGRGSGGMFFWRGNSSGLAVFAERRDRGDLLSVLQHEGFHQFAWIKMRDNLPIWVNEGLAEYFGDAIVVDGKVRHGIVNAHRLNRLRSAQERGQLIPFADVLELNSEKWFANMRNGSEQGHLQYDQSWSIVHFLIHDSPKKIRPAFEQYLKLLSTNRDPRQTWNEAFGRDSTAAFQARYERFLGKLEPDPYSAALTRLRFLASGLGVLHQDADDADSPETLDDLREALIARGFGVTYRAHGITNTYRSDDPDMYGYGDRRGNEHAFTLEAGEDGLPATIHAAKLSPPARIVWVRDEDGGLRSDVAFGR